MKRVLPRLIAVGAIALVAGATVGGQVAWSHLLKSRYEDQARATCEQDYAWRSPSIVTVTFYPWPPSWRCTWTPDLTAPSDGPGSGGTVLLWWNGR